MSWRLPIPPHAHTPLLLALLLMLTGCLPSSCQRTRPEALFPADSLSRRIAQQTPVDTLRLVWQSTGSEAHPLQYPRTVRYGPGGRLYVSDVKANSVFALSADDGAFKRKTTHERFAFPYLAGWRGDTLLVFNPKAGRVDFMVGDTVARSIPTPSDLPEDNPLQYATATDSALYFKAVGEDFDSYLARLDEQGAIQTRYALWGPYWRHAGLLQTWGDTLLSLSGYRPVIDVLAGGALDTLALQGFDSPMLERSHAFVAGDVDKAPLLTASAAPAGDRLFVLNLRPGWLRIDIYDRTGRLQRALVEPAPKVNQKFYPMDLAVRRRAGGYDIAVVTAKPEPRLALYRWDAHDRSAAASSSSR